jgi:hypothetical protein
MQSHPKQYQHIAHNKVKLRESTVEGGNISGVKGGGDARGVGVEGGDGVASREATMRVESALREVTAWRRRQERRRRRGVGIEGGDGTALREAAPREAVMVQRRC